jgi:hypothetical protein
MNSSMLCGLSGRKGSYRKGVGRIWKDVWDSENARLIDVSLG